MSAPWTPWAQRAATASAAAAPAPTQRPVHIETFGPFVVTQLDDGTPWWYGAPPRSGFRGWAAGPAALSLALVRAIIAAIEATNDPARLARWAQLLADGHATDPVVPDLLAWIATRHRRLGEPAVCSPFSARGG